MDNIAGKKVTEWIDKLPLLKDIVEYQPVVWLNEQAVSKSTYIKNEKTGMEDIKEAADRWERFAPYLNRVFPELKTSSGKMESPLKNIFSYKEAYLSDYLGKQEKLYLKCDHLLPVAGSIKARGGIYEVLKHAEQLAIENDMITVQDDYSKFADQDFKDFFQSYSIGVGSTGNLALSIGIAGTKLGFHVDVYMSRDAKQWKKDLLRQHGVRVHEFEGDFSEAIKSGRERTLAEPNGYFIDDEKSKDLFLGYSVAALELKRQLDSRGIEVSKKQPLFVYLPCGVGGSPGGIAFGLKMLFGSNVHCFFAEPTHSPSVLIGLMTGLNEKISVQDFGLDNKTAADGLAVGRPSSFASSISSRIVSGIYTESDENFYLMGYRLWKSEGLFVEPSAAAGLSGPVKLSLLNYHNTLKIPEDKAIHIAWSTGGSLVPDEEREQIYANGQSTINDV